MFFMPVKQPKPLWDTGQYKYNWLHLLSPETAVCIAQGQMDDANMTLMISYSCFGIFVFVDESPPVESHLRER